MSASLPLRFSEAAGPVLEPVSKLGGQPVWLGEPQWPLSGELSAPMRFLGQIALPGDVLSMAYLFMTDDEEDVDDTWDAEAGENALLIQPGGRVPSFLETVAAATGPTLDRELLAVPGDGADLAEVMTTRIGGEPTWLQSPEDPGAGWNFAFQLDAEDADGMVNFGDGGVGYAFVSSDRREGRFYWQCS